MISATKREDCQKGQELTNLTDETKMAMYQANSEVKIQINHQSRALQAKSNESFQDSSGQATPMVASHTKLHRHCNSKNESKENQNCGSSHTTKMANHHEQAIYEDSKEELMNVLNNDEQAELV